MDSIRIFGYKSFKKLEVQLHPINLLIGANGAGKSNFLSLFEMLGNVYEKRLGAYVAQVGGVDKLLYQGRKVTDKIDLELRQDKNFYHLELMEADGKLMIQNEAVGYSNFPARFESVNINQYADESKLKEYVGTRSGDYLNEYISQIRKFHFHDTGRRSPFTADSSSGTADSFSSSSISTDSRMLLVISILSSTGTSASSSFRRMASETKSANIFADSAVSILSVWHT